LTLVADDVLPESFVSPAYVAVIECAPAWLKLVVSLAVPPLSAIVPRVPLPSLKVTLPLPLETVAVKVTDCPKAALLIELLIVVVVDFCATDTPTAEDELVLLLTSPL
jgi:hypothetical protein